MNNIVNKMDIYKQEVHVFPVEGMFAAHVSVQELL